MPLLIHTSVVPPRERAAYWADASRSAFHPLRICADPSQPFGARMWRDRLGSIGVFRIAAGANTMSRTPREVAAGDPEALHLQLLLSGRLLGAQAGRGAVLRPGDMVGYDTSQPATFRAEGPFDLLVLRLPKATLGKRAASISRLTAITIPGDAGVARLAGRFFFDAATGLADGSIGRDDQGLEGHFVDLVRRLYVDLGACTQPTRPRSAAELLLQAQAQIDAHLGDCDLGPDEVARACFISTRYLYRVFESEGLSVSDFIRSERLERCRRDLIDPALATQPIQAIASRWGFNSASHFCRLFRAAYGCTPSTYRAERPSVGRASWQERATPFGPPSRRAAHAAAWLKSGWTPTISREAA
jgi:AraC-like DNA-binding protein